MISAHTTLKYLFRIYSGNIKIEIIILYDIRLLIRNQNEINIDL